MDTMSRVENVLRTRRMEVSLLQCLVSISLITLILIYRFMIVPPDVTSIESAFLELRNGTNLMSECNERI